MKLSFLFVCYNPLVAIATKLNHVGCFYNTSDMSISNKHTDENMTVSLCNEKCKQFNEDYTILSSGDTCLCGNSQFEPVDDCSMLCTGDSEQTCGGEKSVDIYRTNDDKFLNEYMDCFVDDEEERVMDYFIVIEKLTPAKCRLHCSSIGNSLYYAMQHKNECFCGSSDVFSDYDKHGVGKCDLPCEGDSSVTCGGFYAFDLYRFDKPCPEPEAEESEPEAEESESEVEIDVEIGGELSETEESETQTSYSTAYSSETEESETETSYSTAYSSETEESETETEESETQTEEAETETEEAETETEEAETETEETETETEEAETQTEEAETETEESESEVSTGDPGIFQELLDLHNLVRCEHGAEPLKWSTDVQKSAQWYADKLSSEKCGKLEHSTPEERNNYGENLYYCGSSSIGCYNAPMALTNWYTEEEGDGSVESYGNHRTQILWKSSSFLGCGLAQCESAFKYDLVVCQFDPSGNMISDLLQEVGPFEGQC